EFFVNVVCGEYRGSSFGLDLRYHCSPSCFVGYIFNTPNLSKFFFSSLDWLLSCGILLTLQFSSTCPFPSLSCPSPHISCTGSTLGDFFLSFCIFFFFYFFSTFFFSLFY